MSASVNPAQSLPARPESERFLLGALLIDDSLMDTAMVLNPDDFSIEQHRLIFDVMKTLSTRGDRLDYVAVFSELQQRGKAGYTSLSYLNELTEGIPAGAGLSGHVRTIQEKALLRRGIFALQHFMNRCFQPDDSPGNLLLDCQKALDALSQGHQLHGDWITPTEVVRDYPGGPHGFVSRKQGGVGIATPWPNITELLGGGLHAGDLFLIAGRPSMGKAQPLDSPVLTTDGWRMMADLEVGTQLASVDGGASTVTAVHPQGYLPIYRVVFSDGRATQCTAEHLWTVKHRQWKSPQTISTDRLTKLLNANRNRGRLSIPLSSVEFPQRYALPIDPWLLGLLLGDGNFCHSLSFTSADDEIVERARSILSPQFRLTRSGKCGYVIVTADGHRVKGSNRVRPNALHEKLKWLGLWGKQFDNKSIPPLYLYGSKETRLEILRGLMDSDGTVERDGTLRFSTGSHKLAVDVQFLVRSLGGCCTIRTKKPSFQGGKVGALSYVLTLRHKNASEFVWLQRKQKRTLGRRYQPCLTITRIEPAGIAPCQCITVSHPTGTYLTNDFIVTHNSVVGMQIAHKGASQGHGCALFSLEMSKESLTERLLCGLARVDNHKLRAGYLNATEKNRLMECAADLETLPLWIDDTRARTMPAMTAALRKLCAKQTVEVVVVDHLQLMTSGAKKRDQRNQELGEILHEFKHEASKLNATVVLLSQLNRQCEIENRQPQLSDLGETGSAEQDADVVLFVHRPERYAKNRDREDLRGHAEFIIAKQRCGPVGSKNMLFLAGHQRFENRAEDLQ